MPLPTTSISTLPLPPIHFTTIIEADHNHITSLALRFRNPHCSPLHLHQTLLELSWRLTRHDISEELVMRPAFVRFLGPEGQEMARHDRLDHEAFKQRISALLSLVDQKGLDDEDVKRSLRGTLRDMQTHMDEESGGQLVRFADVVGKEDSLRLGREYVLSLALVPGVEVCGSSRQTGDSDGDGDGGSSGDHDGETSGRERCFPGGVAEYNDADTQRFREIMARLLHDAAGGRDRGYLVERVREELGVLGLGGNVFDTKL